MLLLNRKTGEQIRISDDVTITILEVSGSQVRIGIDAPRDVTVHREEIYKRIQKQNSDGSEPRQDGPKVSYINRKL